jgi:hypothetical protein
MPNIDAPKGFWPVRRNDGSPYTGQVEHYLIPASDATAVYIGDVVDLAGSSGAAGTVVSGINVEGMPTIVRHSVATTGQAIVGVVVGFKYAPGTTLPEKKHREASTARVAMVALARDNIFAVQEDADTTPIAAASVGLNVALILTAGSATTGLSAMEIDSSTVATTATMPVRILGLHRSVGNAFNTAGSGSDQAIFEVKFNTEVFADNVAGV